MTGDLSAEPQVNPSDNPNESGVVTGTSSWAMNFPSMKSLAIQGESFPLAMSGLSVISNSKPS